MRKNPILIFTLIILALTLGAVAYIQSASFARVVKKIATRYVPKNLGIQGDFDHLQVKLFPPGLAIVDPHLTATGPNPADLPEGSEVKAERLELTFRPFQIISGRVRVHEVRIVNGSLRTSLQPTKKKANISLSWDDLFQVQADRLALENTHVNLGIPAQKLELDFIARNLELERAQVGDRAYYDLLLHVDTVQAKVPPSWKYPTALDSIRTSLEVDPTGVLIKELEVVREGTQLVSSGAVRGDLLSGKGLKAELKLSLSADLERMLTFLTEGSGKQNLPTGHVKFEGEVKGELDRPAETLQASGTLEGEKVDYARYHFDRVFLEGSYAARVKGRAFRVKKAIFESAAIPKAGGFQPGSGGRLEIGAFEYSPENPKPIETKLRLDNAHVHWLSAIVLKEMYSLDGRITGDAQLQVIPPPNEKDSFTVNADVDWKVAGFQLDNQRYQEKKPLSRLLAIPAIQVKGKLRVRKDELAFLQTDVSIKRSQLQVGGRIRFLDQVNYELEAGGPIDLSEITVLAENPIHGVGPMGVHVSGTADAVVLDFDSDIRDFRYLRMNFGDFRGRISWEDAPSLLHFRDLDCNRARTRYTVGGQMNFADRATMDLRVKVPTGNIADFNTILADLTREFWWYPQRLAGAMSGNLRVYGGVGLDEMKIDVAIDGQGWDLYGERMNQVLLRGGYDRGRFFLSNFSLVKRQGSLTGAVSYDEKQFMQWTLQSDNLSLTDFDHIARLEVPIRGRVLARSQGSGGPGKIESITEVQILDTNIRGKTFAASDLVIQSANGVAIARGQVAGGQAKAELKYDLTEGNASYLKAEAVNLDFTPGVYLLNPSLIQNGDLVGTLSGKYELNFQTGKADLGSGFGHLDQYRLALAEKSFVLEKPVHFNVQEGSFLVPALTLAGPTGKVTASLRSNHGALTGDVRGRLDLALLEFVTPLIASAEGYTELAFKIGGTLVNPQMEGSANIREGQVKIPALESPFENARGRIELEGGTLKIVDLSADLAGGRILGEGTIEFFKDRFPAINVEASLSGNKLKVYPFQVAKVRGKITAKGETLPYLVSGRILVESAVSREKVASARGPGLRSAQYTPPPRLDLATDYPLFRLDIAVSAPGNIIVQNEFLDVEARGELRIVNTLENPRPLGEAYAVHGRVLFKDRAFFIQSGRMEFDNPTTINPRFEVVGTTEVSNRKIQMVASGRLDNTMRIEFSSNPPMPENEILSLLALGFTNDDADRRLRSQDRSAYQQGEAASLVLHSLDFNREVQNRTGLQINIDETTDDQTGQSILRRNSDYVTAAGAPKIVIRRRFGDRIDLSVGSTIGVGNSVQREVNAEVKVTRGFSLLGVWDTFEGTTQNNPRRSSYGLDLKLQKRFK